MQDPNDPEIHAECQNFLDRQERIRTALWVYSSIAIRNLPAWSNIWGALQERWPLLSARRVAEQFESNLAAFDTTTELKIEPLYEAFNVFNELCCAGRELYDEFASAPPDDQPIRSDEESALYRSVLSDQLNNLGLNIDSHQAACLLDTEFEEKQKKRMSILAFTFLANVNWTGNMSESKGIQDAIQNGELCLSYLMDRVTRRRRDISLADSIIKFAAKRAIAPEDAVEVVATGSHLIAAGRGLDLNSHSNLASAIRSGRRWKELKDLFGAEIILLGSPAQLFNLSPSTLLDIPRAVRNASDSQFSQLKQLLSTKFGWLKDTCAKLNEVFVMIQTLRNENDEEPNAISNKIQSRIHAAFGDTSFVQRVTLRDSTLLDPFSLVLRTRRALSLCNGASTITHRQGILDFLIRKMALIYWDGMFQQDKEELRQMVDEALTENNETTVFKDWTLKALDSLFDAFTRGKGHPV
jgi:hypothetical protein